MGRRTCGQRFNLLFFTGLTMKNHKVQSATEIYLKKIDDDLEFEGSWKEGTLIGMLTHEHLFLLRGLLLMPVIQCTTHGITKQ